MSEWFEDFFSGAWLSVHGLIRTPEQTRAEVEFVKRLGAKKILDVPCGDGRVGLELAAEGLDVTGVDRGALRGDALPPLPGALGHARRGRAHDRGASVRREPRTRRREVDLRARRSVDELHSSSRIYGYRELLNLLRSAGFTSFESYASFAKEPFGLGSSRLVLVART